MSSKMPKAIVFNCHFNGLSIIQELAMCGVECIAMDSTRSIGTYSKYAKFVKCPDPSVNETDFVQFLYQYCANERVKPVLFPTNDHWAVAISKHKQKLQEVSLPCVADWEAVKTVIQKDVFYQIGQKKGYMTPRTWSALDLYNLDNIYFPVAAKPKFRRNASNYDQTEFNKNMDRLRLTVFRNQKELRDFLEKEKPFIHDLIFQEYIEGMSNQLYTVGVYANKKAEIVGLFTGHKVRGYPADIGDCIVGENYELPENVIENTYRIVKNLGYSGIAEFEYKKDLNTGEFKLIEINPRSWSWIGITPACGVNLPLIAYRDLKGEKVAFTKCDLPSGSVKYIKVLQDMVNSLIRYKKDYPSWHKTLNEWREDIKADRIVYAEFHAKDWLVTAKALADMFVLVPIKKLIKRIVRGK